MKHKWFLLTKCLVCILEVTILSLLSVSSAMARKAPAFPIQVVPFGKESQKEFVEPNFFEREFVKGFDLASVVLYYKKLPASFGIAGDASWTTLSAVASADDAAGQTTFFFYFNVTGTSLMGADIMFYYKYTFNEAEFYGYPGVTNVTDPPASFSQTYRIRFGSPNLANFVLAENSGAIHTGNYWSLIANDQDYVLNLTLSHKLGIGGGGDLCQSMRPWDCEAPSSISDKIVLADLATEQRIYPKVITIYSFTAHSESVSENLFPLIISITVLSLIVGLLLWLRRQT